MLVTVRTGYDIEGSTRAGLRLSHDPELAADGSTPMIRVDMTLIVV